MTEDQGWPVRLYLYDISRGLARSLSQVLLGKYIEGVWYGRFILIFSITCCYKTSEGNILNFQFMYILFMKAYWSCGLWY